jgi:hypothetical protein
LQWPTKRRTLPPTHLMCHSYYTIAICNNWNIAIKMETSISPLELFIRAQ